MIIVILVFILKITRFISKEKMQFIEKSIVYFWKLSILTIFSNLRDVSFSFHSFNSENKIRISRNWTNCSASVSCFRRTQHFDFWSNVQLKTNLVPAYNDWSSSNPQGKRSSTIIAWVKDFAIGELSFVVHFDWSSFGWLSAFLSWFDDFDAVLIGEFFSEKGGGKGD